MLDSGRGRLLIGKQTVANTGVVFLLAVAAPV